MLLLAERGYQAIAVKPRGVEFSSGPWAKTTIYEIAENRHRVIKALDTGPLVAVGHAAAILSHPLQRLLHRGDGR